MNEKKLFKYLQGKASETEIESIYNWIELSQKNKEQFIALKKSWAVNNPQQQHHTDWELLKKGVKIKQHAIFSFYKYAAAATILLGIGGFWYYENLQNIKKHDPNSIILEIENDHSYEILSNQSRIIKSIQGNAIAVQSNNELIYDSNNASDKIVYNTLKTPYGKTIKIKLSDGTLVHLNAGATLRYPQQFVQGQNRKVEIVGEAYFEIAKDEKHPFIIETTEVSIEVLGTKFNLSCYSEDQTIETALVEGSVKIFSNTNNANIITLTPEHLGIWNKTNQSFSINEISSSNYIAWTQGELRFNDMAFQEIATKLERAQNVNISINYPYLEQQKFTGVFKIESLSVTDLLNIIKLDTDFSFTINENTIVINPPTNL